MESGLLPPSAFDEMPISRLNWLMQLKAIVNLHAQQKAETQAKLKGYR